MKIFPDDLPNDVESLKVLLLEQSRLLGEKDSALAVKDNQLAEWASKYERILEQWRLAQQKQFGKSSEVSPGQGELFNEAEELVAEAAAVGLVATTASGAAQAAEGSWVVAVVAKGAARTPERA